MLTCFSTVRMYVFWDPRVGASAACMRIPRRRHLEAGAAVSTFFAEGAWRDCGCHFRDSAQAKRERGTGALRMDHMRRGRPPFLFKSVRIRRFPNVKRKRVGPTCGASLTGAYHHRSLFMFCFPQQASRTDTVAVPTSCSLPSAADARGRRRSVGSSSIVRA